MPDIPDDRFAGNPPVFRCLTCGLRAQKQVRGDCVGNRQGHVWVHQRHLDQYRRGETVPPDAERHFKAYPDACDARMSEDSAREKTSTESPERASKRST